jgi:hypothetical protein
MQGKESYRKIYMYILKDLKFIFLNSKSHFNKILIVF